MNFSGRNAIVTGASRGIGRACALKLAKQGANVGLNFRSNKDEALEVVSEIEAAGQRATLLQGDVADQSFVEGMVAQTAE